MMNISKQTLLVFFSTLFVFSTYGRTTEVPLAILPTGQIVLEIKFPNTDQSQYFIFDATGTNQLRGDLNRQISELGGDTTKSRIEFENLQIGTMKFSTPTKFSINKKLSKRSDLVMAGLTLGTVGPSLFQDKALQFKLAEKKLVIADSFEELEFTDKVEPVPFSSSFTNNIPVLKVNTVKYGEQELYIDPSKPVSFHFSWNAAPADVTARNDGKLKGLAISLDGKDKITLLKEKNMPVYIESDIQVKGHEPTFSDNLIPCIGSTFLKNYWMTIDFINLVMYLDPINDTAKNEISYVGN